MTTRAPARLRAHTRAWALLAATAGLLGLTSASCQDALEDVWGAYEGQSVTVTRTNAGMRTTEQAAIVTLSPTLDDASAVWVGLSDRCEVLASVDGEALRIQEQPCTFKGPMSEDTWSYEGQGRVDAAGALELKLQGRFTRTYSAGTPPLQGTHELSFGGKRRP